MSWQGLMRDWDIHHVLNKGTTPHRKAPARSCACLAHLLKQDWWCLNTRARGSRKKVCVGGHASCFGRGCPTTFLSRKFSQAAQRLERLRFQTSAAPCCTHKCVLPTRKSCWFCWFWESELPPDAWDVLGSVSAKYLRPWLKCHVKERAVSERSGNVAEAAEHTASSRAGRRLSTSC